MKLTIPLRTFLTAEKASVRLYNTLCGYSTIGSPDGDGKSITLSQFIDQWPLERLRKEVYGFSPKAQAELLEIMERHYTCKTGRRYCDYVNTLRQPMIVQSGFSDAAANHPHAAPPEHLPAEARDQARARKGDRAQRSARPQVGAPLHQARQPMESHATQTRIEGIKPMKYICLDCKTKFASPPPIHQCHGDTQPNTLPLRIIPLAEYNPTGFKYYVTVEVIADDMKLAAKCRDRIAKVANKEVDTLLKLKPVKRDNVAFSTKTNQNAIT